MFNSIRPKFTSYKGLERSSLSCIFVRFLNINDYSRNEQDQQDNNIPNSARLWEEEKELFSLKRKMSTFFSQGLYRKALEQAQSLVDRTATYGTNTAIFASSINNLALMVNSLLYL